MKQIVVVYSHSGAAYAYAEAFAKQHNADLFRIQPKFEPQGFFYLCAQRLSGDLQKTGQTQTEDHINLKHYEHMTVVAPIHAGKGVCSGTAVIYVHPSEPTLPKVDIVS